MSYFTVELIEETLENHGEGLAEIIRDYKQIFGTADNDEVTAFLQNNIAAADLWTHTITEWDTNPDEDDQAEPIHYFDPVDWLERHDPEARRKGWIRD